MSKKAKSIFTGSIAFIIFAMIRNFIPVRNMIFYVIACAVFIIIALLSYIILSGKKNTTSYEYKNLEYTARRSPLYLDGSFLCQ